MTKKRDSITIIHDILFVINEKESRSLQAKPTHIMFKANLSHQMLTDYISELIEKKFIIEQTQKKGNKNYSLTEKGHHFLHEFRVIKSFIDSYDLN